MTSVAGAGPTPGFLLDLLAREILAFKDYFLCLFISEKIKNKQINKQKNVKVSKEKK